MYYIGKTKKAYLPYFILCLYVDFSRPKIFVPKEESIVFKGRSEEFQKCYLNCNLRLISV